MSGIVPCTLFGRGVSRIPGDFNWSFFRFFKFDLFFFHLFFLVFVHRHAVLVRLGLVRDLLLLLV